MELIEDKLQRLIEEQKAAKEETKLQRDYSKWLNRRVDRITVRVNDGTNQCLPPQVWLVLGQRLAAYTLSRRSATAQSENTK